MVPAPVDGSANRQHLWTAHGRRRVSPVSLERTTSRGWEVLHLSSDALGLDLVPALGGTVTSLRRRDGRELLASTPWGLPFVGSRSVPGNAEAEMLDTSPGGWEPLFPNAGQSVNVHGTEWGFDGEARVTWLEHQAAGSHVVLRGRLRRAPFLLTRTFSVEGAQVRLEERVHNVGGEPIEVMWGSRLLLGGDLLGADTVVDTAASIVRPDPRVSGVGSYEDLLPWPRAYAEGRLVNLRSVPASDARTTRLAYLSELGRPWARVHRPSADLALELDWDGDVWPYLWYALEAGGRTDYPWYGRGYHLALTPASSWPSSGLHEVRRTSGTTVWVPAGTTLAATLTLTVSTPS